MLAIIGCGNPTRRDDGVGPHVIQRLMANSDIAEAGGVSLFDAGTDGMAVMYKARGCDALILIDACSSGETPGAIFEVPGDEFDDRPPQGQNPHAFRWDHALYAGRRIYADDFPREVSVLLVEVEDIGPGLTLSEPVEAAASQLQSRIEDRVQAYLRHRCAKPAEVHHAAESL